MQSERLVILQYELNPWKSRNYETYSEIKLYQKLCLKNFAYSFRTGYFIVVLQWLHLKSKLWHFK